jgi:hypothetical protein
MANQQQETIYRFIIKLEGSVMAKNEKEANAKINGHLDDLGEIESHTKYDLGWQDCSWDLFEGEN